jgi:hypothetical protein
MLQVSDVPINDFLAVTLAGFKGICRRICNPGTDQRQIILIEKTLYFASKQQGKTQNIASLHRDLRLNSDYHKLSYLLIRRKILRLYETRFLKFGKKNQ